MASEVWLWPCVSQRPEPRSAACRFESYAPDLDDDHIFTDKQSGKNFNRKQYIKLKSILLPGDEVLVEELDRLGRNKEEIKAELEWFKAHGSSSGCLTFPPP